MQFGTALVLVLLAPLAVRAQTPGQCHLGGAEGVLDVNDVRAMVFNTGALFFGNTTTDGTGYLVPKDPGTSPIFAATFWVGGRVEGEIRVSGARYTRYEMWPGPLYEDATLPNPADCTPYDRIFVVSRDDVRRYLETGVMTDDLRDWPYALGAPVLDGDGIDGNYNLDGGDQPAIYGDQTAWWVMNDVGNVHAETGSQPLGVEVQVAAFSSARGPLPIQQATYYRYRILNRNTRPIEDAYVSLHVDVELGDGGDDYIGSDTTHSMGFGYNGDDYDGWPDYDFGYGAQPPAIGIKVVQGPIGLPNGRDDDRDGVVDEPGERMRMTAHGWYCGSCPQPGTGDPVTKEEYYAMMQGFWKDGTPYTEWRGGYQPNPDAPTTRFYMAGDPVTAACWSKENGCDGKPTGGAGNREKSLVHTGPFRLEPGEETEVVFAFPFARGRDRLDSVTELRRAAESVQAAWDTGFLAPSRVDGQRPPPVLPLAIEITTPTPNPFTDRLSLRYTLPEALAVRVAVLDVLGREVAVLSEGRQSAGPHEVEWNAEGSPAGTYLVRVEAAGETRAFPVTRRR